MQILCCAGCMHFVIFRWVVHLFLAVMKASTSVAASCPVQPCPMEACYDRQLLIYSARAETCFARAEQCASLQQPLVVAELESRSRKCQSSLEAGRSSAQTRSHAAIVWQSAIIVALIASLQQQRHQHWVACAAQPSEEAEWSREGCGTRWNKSAHLFALTASFRFAPH